MKYILGLLIPLYALDQLTKWWIIRQFPYETDNTIIPGFFHLVHWRNTGAAFSILEGHGWFFIVLAFCALIIMAWMAWKGQLREPISKVSFALLAAGILGNLTDRILHGYVTDFLLFYLHVPFANPWPAFNVADSCICIAAVLLIWESIFSEKPSKISKPL